MASRRPEVVIVGGGVIGLACAWSLARAGCMVSVLDSAPAAREASWAAAGMLAPHHEADGSRELWSLGVASWALWGGFTTDLCSAPRVIDYHDRGGLVPMFPGESPDVLEERYQRLTGMGVEARLLSGEDLNGKEPGLKAAAALWLPGGHVDPRRLCRALVESVERERVAVHYGCRVVSIDRADVVISDGRRFIGDQVVLASGAWTPDLAALCGVALEGEPVKGQMVRLTAPDGLISCFLHHHQAYVVPRTGAGVVVGSTMVLDGFDKHEDPLAIGRLVAGARSLIPALAHAPVAESWTGLRPRLSGGLPVIARAGEQLVIATGHFRNGILLTPITARVVTALVLGEEPPWDLAPFQLPGGATGSRGGGPKAAI